MFKSISKVIQRSLLALMVVLFASPLQAQTGTGRINSTGLYQTQAGGWYTSPYQAIFANVQQVTPGFALPTTNTLYDIFCVDFYHHDQSYNANFSNLADVASVKSYTRTGDTTKYRMAAWLASQLDVVRPLHNSVKNATINAAIWQVMGATTITLGISQNDINTWKHNAETGDINAADWVVITDVSVVPKSPNMLMSYVAPTDGQEFVTRVQVTPEPATMLLLGSGLMIMLLGAGIIRRPLA